MRRAQKNNCINIYQSHSSEPACAALPRIEESQQSCIHGHNGELQEVHGTSADPHSICRGHQARTTCIISPCKQTPPITRTIIMTVLPPSSCSFELCNRSSSVLATRDRIAPGALPVSLRKHPIWGHIVAHEGSAYERNCAVADAHRHVNSIDCVDPFANGCRRAQFLLPSALRARKKDDLFERPASEVYRLVYTLPDFRTPWSNNLHSFSCVKEALHSFKYDKTGSSSGPLPVAKACVVQVSSKLFTTGLVQHAILTPSACNLQHGSALGMCTEQKLRRKNGCDDLRTGNAV